MLVLLAALGAVFLLWGWPALAAGPATVTMLCGDTYEIEDALESRFNERAVVTGVATKGVAVVTLWAAPGAVTWTVTISFPNYRTCVVAAGEDYAVAPQPREEIAP